MKYSVLGLVCVLEVLALVQARTVSTQLRAHRQAESAFKAARRIQTIGSSEAPGTAAQALVPELAQIQANSTKVSEPDDSSGSGLTGSDRLHVFWPKDRGSGLVAWIFAALFCLMIASIPFTLHMFGGGGSRPPIVAIIEGACLLVWLIGGLILFTQVLLFQSPHFGDEIRPLNLVEAVYLFAQIITTVGYGDITPAKTRGQVFVGFFVFIAIILIGGMVSEIANIIIGSFESETKKMIEKATALLERGGVSKKSDAAPHKIGPVAPSFLPVLYTAIGFSCMCAAGTCFYHFYPGEGKSVGQGVYMSLITLSTVGFGAFTPVTEAGMVFGAFWMILGVASLGSVVGAFTAYVVALKKYETAEKIDEAEAEAALRKECCVEEGKMDKAGYLRYALLKWAVVEKDKLDHLFKQFDHLDESKTGRIHCDAVSKLKGNFGDVDDEE